MEQVSRVSRCGTVVFTVTLSLAAVILLIRIPEFLYRLFDPDEFEHLHAAFCINNGMVPYRDFFEHHTPLFWMGLQPLYLFFENPIRMLLAGRLLMFFVTVGIVLVTCQLSSLLYGRCVGVISVLLLICIQMFVEKSMEIRPDGLETLFWLLFLQLGIRAIHSERGFVYFLFGICAGISILFSQKVIPGIAGVFLAWRLLNIKPQKERPPLTLSRFALFSAGVLLPVVLTGLLFLFFGAFGAFVHRCFLFNALWEIRTGPFPVCLEFVRENPMVFALGVVGILYLLRNCREAPENALLLGSLAGTGVGIIWIPIMQRQYLMLLYPLWAICAAKWMADRVLYEKQKSSRIYDFLFAVLLGVSLAISSTEDGRPFGNHLFILLIFVGTCVFSVLFLRVREALTVFIVMVISLGPILKPLQPNYVRNTAQKEYIRLIDEETDPDDCVLDGWSGYAFFRPHAYYYFFLHPEIRAMLTGDELDKNVIEAIQRNKPKIIIYDSNLRSLPSSVNEHIRSHYRAMGLDDLYRRAD
ncbi:MAG TPA: glycosyltransferase family 39 protein [bacterium]|nr:glycosyltransferase family 39 protein [bacterium]HQL63898.1 glycosyltransferase family 39 protein [bacterium]